MKRKVSRVTIKDCFDIDYTSQLDRDTVDMSIKAVHSINHGIFKRLVAKTLEEFGRNDMVLIKLGETGDEVEVPYKVAEFIMNITQICQALLTRVDVRATGTSDSLHGSEVALVRVPVKKVKRVQLK